MFEIRCDKKGNWAEIADAVYVETAQREALSAELVFAGEAEIRRLNRETRAVDRVTDVLSYPTLDGIRGKTLKLRDFPFDAEEGTLMVGSVVICRAQARAQAEEYGQSEEREITYLLIHGLLHLLGYDHMTEEDKREMRALEKRVLARLGEEEV